MSDGLPHHIPIKDRPVKQTPPCMQGLHDGGGSIHVFAMYRKELATLDKGLSKFSKIELLARVERAIAISMLFSRTFCSNFGVHRKIQ